MSLPDDQVASTSHAVEQGRAPSVSGYISVALTRAEHEHAMTKLLDDLDCERGAVTDDDLAWADKALGLS